MKLIDLYNQITMEKRFEFFLELDRQYDSTRAVKPIYGKGLMIIYKSLMRKIKEMNNLSKAK